MPRVRVTRGRRPGTEKIGRGNVHRVTAPPQPPSPTTEYVPDTPRPGAQQGRPEGTRPGTQQKAAPRTFKAVPGEPVYMAEGGVIGAIEGIGEPVEKSLTFLHKMTRVAEGIARTTLANNQGIADRLKGAEDNVGSILAGVQSRLK